MPTLFAQRARLGESGRALLQNLSIEFSAQVMVHLEGEFTGGVSHYKTHWLLQY